MSTTPAPLTFREVFKIAALRRLWLAQLVSVCGDFLAIYAIFAVVSFRMHASANAVSLVLVFYLLPLAIVSPLAGVFVDSWNVKRTMIASDLTRAVLFLLLLFAHSLWQIYAILLAASTVSSFFLPAQTITLRTVVPMTGLTSANALIQQAFYMMQIISPAVSGLLVSAFGPNSCFWIDAATFLFSAGMISTMTIPHQPAPALKSVRSMATETGVGVKFIFTHPSISFVITAMAAGMFAIRCFGALLAVYVRDVLRGSTSMFGLLGSLIGVGMIFGTQLVRRAVRGRSNSHIVTGGLAAVGFSIGLIALFGTTPAAVIGILMLGFFLAFIIVPAQVLMQEHTPKNMLGRVTGSMVSVIIASQVLGMLFAGEIATTVGIRNVYYGSAALLFVLAGAGYYWLSRGTAQAPAAAA
ncbi:MAG TPA: MFS transporter [Bryobacteraceae bacterium]|nr:MFS transporter [Bryobacteraceae bacterium]